MNEVEKLRGLLVNARESVRYQMGMQNRNHEAGQRRAADFADLLKRIDAALSEPVEPAPAQNEQQPAACRYRKADGADRAWTYSGSVTAPADGYEVQYLYAAPIAQTEQQPATVPEGWKLVPLRDTTEMMKAALSQQVAAQDGREAFTPEIYRANDAKDGQYLGPVVLLIEHNRAIEQARATRPAQTEQQPVAYADPQAFVNFGKARQDGIEAGPRTHEWMWANPGSCLVPLYAAPIAQTAPQPEHSGSVNKLRALAEIWDQNADEADEFGNAQAAEALRLAAFELRAALSAQGTDDAGAQS